MKELKKMRGPIENETVKSEDAIETKVKDEDTIVLTDYVRDFKHVFLDSKHARKVDFFSLLN